MTVRLPVTFIRRNADDSLSGQLSEMEVRLSPQPGFIPPKQSNRDAATRGYEVILPTGSLPPEWDATEQLEASYTLVRSLLDRLLPERAAYPPSFTIHPAQEDSAFQLKGSSFGLPLTIGMIGASLQLPLRTNILATGSISSSGTLGMVDLAAKLQMLLDHEELVDRFAAILIPPGVFTDPEDQQTYADLAARHPSKIFRPANIYEALAFFLPLSAALEHWRTPATLRLLLPLAIDGHCLLRDYPDDVDISELVASALPGDLHQALWIECWAASWSRLRHLPAQHELSHYLSLLSPLLPLSCISGRDVPALQERWRLLLDSLATPPTLSALPAYIWCTWMALGGSFIEDMAEALHKMATTLASHLRRTRTAFSTSVGARTFSAYRSLLRVVIASSQELARCVPSSSPAFGSLLNVLRNEYQTLSDLPGQAQMILQSDFEEARRGLPDLSSAGSGVLLDEDTLGREAHFPRVLSIQASPDLTHMAYELPAAFLPRGLNVIEDPVVLWDRPSEMPERLRSEGFTAAMDRMLLLPDGNPDLRPAWSIPELFASDCNVLSYDDCTASWFPALHQWPYSIDSLFVARTLRECGYLNRPLPFLLEIGCGTGFLGAYVGRGNISVADLAFSDIDQRALLHARYNARQNGLFPRTRVHSALAAGVQGLLRDRRFIDVLNEHGRAAVAIVTPPYLPATDALPGFGTARAISGTQLLEECVALGHLIADEIIIEFPTICQPEFTHALNANRAHIEDVECLADFSAAFRIAPLYPYFWSERERRMQWERARRQGHVKGHPDDRELQKWRVLEISGRKYLHDLLGRGLEEVNRYGYRYFLRLLCYRLRFRRSSTGSR